MRFSKFLRENKILEEGKLYSFGFFFEKIETTEKSRTGEAYL